MIQIARDTKGLSVQVGNTRYFVEGFKVGSCGDSVTGDEQKSPGLVNLFLLISPDIDQAPSKSNPITKFSMLENEPVDFTGPENLNFAFGGRVCCLQVRQGEVVLHAVGVTVPAGQIEKLDKLRRQVLEPEKPPIDVGRLLAEVESSIEDPRAYRIADEILSQCGSNLNLVPQITTAALVIVRRRIDSRNGGSVH